MKHLDDFRPGQIFTFQSSLLTEPVTIAFATQGNPQRLHTDKEYASRICGDLIASEFQTQLTVFNPIMHELLADVTDIGGTGFNCLRWYTPERLHRPPDITLKTVAIRPSRASLIIVS